MIEGVNGEKLSTAIKPDVYEIEWHLVKHKDMVLLMEMLIGDNIQLTDDELYQSGMAHILTKRIDH